MKKEKMAIGHKLFMAYIVLEVGKKVMEKVSKQMGFEDMENFNCYLDQCEYDQKGLGINGKFA